MMSYKEVIVDKERRAAEALQCREGTQAAPSSAAPVL